ncbi:hypothetical protein BV898_18197 [Hypsibius exemplaris]|uniref:MAM domain-containing protein n=1 Tax=Hypsibius exemplaris TaxID=2072580 RepID=A0A9X6NJB8_HYPEX|nr:hypothetical protein BV898_18197 [Hypsibius exemplaris]
MIVTADRFLFSTISNAATESLVAQVISPVIPRLPRRSDYCLKFSMQFDAKESSKLQIMLHRRPGTQQTLVHEFLGSPRQLDWRSVEIDFSYPLEFQISLRVEAGPRSIHRAGMLSTTWYYCRDNAALQFTTVPDQGKEWHRFNIHDTENIMAPIVPTRPNHLSSDRFLLAELTNKAINTVAGQLVSSRVPRVAGRAEFCLKFSMFFEAPDLTKLKIMTHRLPEDVQKLVHETISVPDLERCRNRLPVPLGIPAEIVNTNVGKVCDFEENECGFINAGRH